MKKKKDKKYIEWELEYGEQFGIYGSFSYFIISLNFFSLELYILQLHRMLSLTIIMQNHCKMKMKKNIYARNKGREYGDVVQA